MSVGWKGCLLKVNNTRMINKCLCNYIQDNHYNYTVSDERNFIMSKKEDIKTLATRIAITRELNQSEIIRRYKDLFDDLKVIHQKFPDQKISDIAVELLKLQNQLNIKDKNQYP